MEQINYAVRRDDMENRIAELRKARRISQAELAEAVAVTRQTIISLESGRYNASLLLAHKIAKYFDTTIEDIFLFEEEEP
jgi:putative transcriptional regulator